MGSGGLKMPRLSASRHIGSTLVPGEERRNKGMRQCVGRLRLLQPAPQPKRVQRPNVGLQ